ncbi:hypothetical protein KKG45_08190, partial [bacterium]|nr:hypothetical protein [bacterium]
MKHDARILICLLVLLAPALAMGFDPVHEWSDSYGGVGPQGVNSRVVIDGSGNIIVAGAFVSMVDFGPLQIAGGGYDFYVAKFDADRNLLWAEGFGGSGTEKLTALDVDSSGYIYLAGHFDEDIDFGGDAHVTQGLNDIFVVKLDPAGESTWSRSYGDDQQDYAFCLAINADDQVVLGGCFEGTVDFGGIPLTNTEPGFDSYLVMLDAAGDHVWSNSYGNDQELAITCLSVDSSSDIVLAGYFLADFDFGGGPLICAGLTDIFVVKLGADGEHIWSHSYGDIAQDGASSLAIDSDDDVLLLGDFIGTVDFGGGGLTSAGSGDYFLVKFQSNGSHAWSHRYGDVNNQAAPWPIVADPLDNVLVTGQFFGDYDVGGEILHSSDSDVLFMMLDTDGNHLWSQNYGDSEDQRSYDIAVDEAGDSYLAGGYAGTLDFGGDPVVCADVQDAFLAKLRLNPKTWLVRLDGTGDATTIQGGIDLAAPGDTVLVACDYYYEHDIVMKSGLTLRSATREAECAVILPQQQGRAIYCGNGVGDVRIEGFTFNSGQADEGGGVCCFNAEAVLTNCDFLGNSADNGGGLYVSSESGDTVELHGCSFIWNSAPAGYGGGACIDGAFLDMSECTFLFNEAQYGGGVAGFGCEGGATHCTLAGNSGAVAGGGMYFDDYSSCGMACSIIAFSQSGEAAYGPPDDVSALDCDVYANAGGDFVAGLSGDEGFNNFSADPLFCNYENWNVSLRSDSPCAQHDPYGQVGSKGVGCWPSVCTDYEQFVHCDGGIPTPYTTDVVISGDQSHAFLSGGSWGLCSVNIAEAPDLEIVGSVPTPGYARRLALSGDYLYIADDYAGLQVAYVAEPAAMELVGPGIVTPGDAVDVAVSGDYAFVAAEAAGVQVIYIAELPDLEIVAAFPPPSGGEARGIVISGNRAYIAAWGAGLQILDISTPTAPSEVDVVDLSAYADGVAISADRNHAYVAAGYAGLEIVSLAGGPPFSVHTIDTGIARDVTVGGELAYVADDVGLVIVGVSDPGNPQILGSAGTHEYANSVAVVGDQGFVAVAYYGLEVVDLSHPEGAPRTGSADTYIAQDVVVSGLHAYIADGSRQLTVVDVSDPSAPVVNDQLEWGSWARAVAISGDYAYLAQDAGIQAVRISDPYAIVPTSGLLATPGQCKDLALS